MTKSGNVHHKYLSRLDDFFNCEEVRTWDLGNSGRGARELNWVEDLKEVVELCGYEVQLHNDAPRGGRGGEFYQKAGNKIKFNESAFFSLIEDSH